jgi:hypothetical protein
MTITIPIWLLVLSGVVSLPVLGLAFYGGCIIYAFVKNDVFGTDINKK